MRITNVQLKSTEAAEQAGCPALTPELLAACGARYSRNNEGLEAILEKIDQEDTDRSVDRIFSLIDYGHKSIGDMAPVSMFLDNVSMFLVYLIWSWCPTASGQESSTRYIKMDRTGLVDPALLGVPEDQRDEWYRFMQMSFDAYGEALKFWTSFGNDNPEATGIPQSLLADPSEKAQKQVARMKRNFAFDRARYFLPVAASTNVTLIMNANGWVELCQNLLNHWLPEANLLGEKIRESLSLSVPRMVKHAVQKPSWVMLHNDEFKELVTLAQSSPMPLAEAQCISSIDLFLPPKISEKDLVDALKNHDNRYAGFGSPARRTSARFSWSAVSFAEMRDLNRHRTGHKYSPLVPVGFYCAQDQLSKGKFLDSDLIEVGLLSLNRSHSRLALGQTSFWAWMLLGNQFFFEHTTQLDKFVYECELRTGLGAHYRYAQHFRDIVATLKERFPLFADAIPIGTSEPE